MPTAPDDFKAAAERLAKNGNGAHDQATVCVLDDDVSLLKALERLLRSEGFHIETFSKPSIFLSAVTKNCCRVAIMDVWMPDMNGLEVQAALRKDAPETRVIFISGRNDPSVRRAALDAGAIGFLSKPFDDEVLLRIVRSAAAI